MMDDYDVFDFTHDDITHRVFHRGDGPAVVLMHEISGLDEKYITSIGKLEDRLIILLDLNELIKDEILELHG